MYVEDVRAVAEEGFRPVPTRPRAPLPLAGHGVYGVNARFTGGTGMRAAVGFNGVEAAWRHFVEGEEKPDCLTFDKDLVVCRYLAETVVRKDDLDELRQRGKWRASS